MNIGKIPDTEITNVSAFVEAVSKFERRHVAQWFFRGHSNESFKLVPGLFRQSKACSESFADWDDLETFLLQAFKREAAQFMDSHSLNNEDWLCLAQHHRLPTRLLDWTTNPLIALFLRLKAKRKLQQQSGAWDSPQRTIAARWDPLFSEENFDQLKLHPFPEAHRYTHR